MLTSALLTSLALIAAPAAGYLDATSQAVVTTFLSACRPIAEAPLGEAFDLKSQLPQLNLSENQPAALSTDGGSATRPPWATLSAFRTAGAGTLAVYAAPASSACSVALYGVDGSTSFLTLDIWFTASRSPFRKLDEKRSSDAIRRTYAAKLGSKFILVVTSLPLKPAEQSVKVLATMAQVEKLQ